MGTNEFYEHATEFKRYMHDQPIFVSAEIEDDPIVAYEIDGASELPFDFGGISPSRSGGNREPGPDRSFRMRVTRPEFPQRPTGDHLHCKIISCHHSGDKLGQQACSPDGAGGRADARLPMAQSGVAAKPDPGFRKGSIRVTTLT
jgi:hypothetical protein